MVPSLNCVQIMVRSSNSVRMCFHLMQIVATIDEYFHLMQIVLSLLVEVRNRFKMTHEKPTITEPGAQKKTRM